MKILVVFVFGIKPQPGGGESNFAGYGTFHHPKMVHGSYENRSDRPRRAFVINVFADGTRSDTDAEILSGVPVIKKGKKMEGRFFPLLYAPPSL